MKDAVFFVVLVLLSGRKPKNNLQIHFVFLDVGKSYTPNDTCQD